MGTNMNLMDRFVQCDLLPAVPSKEEPYSSVKIAQSTSTQTQITGPIKSGPAYPLVSTQVQVAPIDLEREQEREFLYIKNVRKLYGSLNRLQQELTDRRSLSPP